MKLAMSQRVSSTRGPGAAARKVKLIDSSKTPGATLQSFAPTTQIAKDGQDLTPLKLLFATALDDGLIRHSPAVTVRVNRHREGEPDDEQVKAMTRAELARLMLAVPASNQLMLKTLIETGARSTELFGLNWGDLQDGRISIRRGYNKVTHEIVDLETPASRRTLPLTPELAAELGESRGDHSDDDPMFATRTGTRYSYRNVYRTLSKAATDAKLDWSPGLHAFRHARASMLLDAGRNIAQVSRWLGHSDANFTLRTYVHLMNDGIGEALPVELSPVLRLVS